MDGQASTYLQKRGYKPRDDTTHSTAADQRAHRYIPDYNPEAFTPAAYEASYGRLRRWLEDALDVFKVCASLDSIVVQAFRRRAELTIVVWTIQLCRPSSDKCCFLSLFTRTWTVLRRAH